jgi:hypothetical protein
MRGVWQGAIARTMHDTHAKPVHTVALPRPSAFCDLPQVC